MWIRLLNSSKSLWTRYFPIGIAIQLVDDDSIIPKPDDEEKDNINVVRVFEPEKQRWNERTQTLSIYKDAYEIIDLTKYRIATLPLLETNIGVENFDVVANMSSSYFVRYFQIPVPVKSAFQGQSCCWHDETCSEPHGYYYYDNRHITFLTEFESSICAPPALNKMQFISQPDDFDTDDKPTQVNGMWCSLLAERLMKLREAHAREMDLFCYDKDGKLRLVNQVYTVNYEGRKVVIIKP